MRCSGEVCSVETAGGRRKATVRGVGPSVIVLVPIVGLNEDHGDSRNHRIHRLRARLSGTTQVHIGERFPCRCVLSKRNAFSEIAPYTTLRGTRLSLPSPAATTIQVSFISYTAISTSLRGVYQPRRPRDDRGVPQPPDRSR